MGLSGGGDSTALLAILMDVARPEVQPVHAIIFDHQLRDGSSEEARTVADRAGALGAHAHILTWQSPHKTQKRARLARHKALAEQCRSLGATTLFLGHTLDDRLETWVMRSSRSDAPRSRAVMPRVSPSPVWPEGRGIQIARPLLEVQRESLREFLKSRDLSWVEDPSNEDESFERIRVRKAISLGWPEALPTSDDLDGMVRSEMDVLSKAKSFLDPVRTDRWGGMKLLQTWSELDEDTGLRAMELALLAVSGQQDMPGVKTTERFVSARLHGQSMTGAGAALTVEGWLGRDPGAVMGRKDGGFGLDAVQLKAGDTTIVDGRFEITAHRDLDILPPDKVICDRLYPNVPELFRRTLIYFHDQHDEPVSMFDESLASVRCLTRDRLEHLTSTV